MQSIERLSTTMNDCIRRMGICRLLVQRIFIIVHYICQAMLPKSRLYVADKIGTVHSIHNIKL